MLPVNCGSHTDYQNFVLANLRKYYPTKAESVEKIKVDQLLPELENTSFDIKEQPYGSLFALYVKEFLNQSVTYYEYFGRVNSTSFIDLNGKGGIKLPYKNDFTIGKDGVPVCKEGRRMNHDGSEPSKHRIKYRCPLASRKYGCSCEHPCSDSKYGRTVHVAMKDNPRLFTNPPRVYFSYSFFLFWIISTFQGSVSSSAGMINQDSERPYILVLFNVCANVCFFAT